MIRLLKSSFSFIIECNLLWIINLLKLTKTFSIFLVFIRWWAIIAYIAWLLVNVDFYSNSWINIFANYAYCWYSSFREVSLSFNLEVSKVFNLNSTSEWLFTTLVHHTALGNWTFFTILIHEKLRCSDVSVIILKCFLLGIT